MIKKFFLLFIIISVHSFSQQIDFQSPQNIKRFADFLFCEKDYLRAIDEYEKYLISVEDDSVQFKIALGFSYINDPANAIKIFKNIKNTSLFFEESKIEILKSLYLLNDFSSFYPFADSLIESQFVYSNNAYKLKNISLLLTENKLIEKEKFLIPFTNEDKNTVSHFFDLKKDPPYKSELLAGVLSTIVPGLGKIYTNHVSDGITALVLTGIFSYLAYTNFEHHHTTRAWIFTAVGAGFYAGNIYGSVASAQIFNAKVNFSFNEHIKLFLQEKNYFTQHYDFCK